MPERAFASALWSNSEVKVCQSIIRILAGANDHVCLIYVSSTIQTKYGRMVKVYIEMHVRIGRGIF